MNVKIKTAPLGRGMGWLTDGLGYFTGNPLGWIAAVVVVFIIMAVVGIIPLGGLLVYIFYPVFVGGFMLGCQAQVVGEGFQFQHVFSGFQSDYLKRLILLGIYYAIANIAIIIILSVVLFFSLGIEFFQQFETMQPEDLVNYSGTLFIITLLATVLFLPVIMAVWFAPALIVAADAGPGSAMMSSFKACLYNVPAFTLYGIIALLLCILAAIPLFLGYIILAPLLTASVYVSYLDCFEVTGNVAEPDKDSIPEIST